MNREAFLARVRQAAQSGRAYRVHLPDIPEGAGYVGASGDLCQAMVSEVEAVGGHGQVVDDWDAARGAVASLLEQSQVRSALCWRHAVLDRLRLDELLASRGVTAHDYDRLVNMSPDDRRQAMLAAEIGISGVDYAVAETGTLVVCSRPGQERVASLLPPVHLAIVEESQIVPDLLDLFEKLSQLEYDSLPSNLVFITGPSKTGDIELQLTTGVHGPGTWHVLVVRSTLANPVEQLRKKE